MIRAPWVRRLLLALAMVVSIWQCTQAQPLPLPTPVVTVTPVDSASPAPQPSPTPIEVAPELASPRATVVGFMQAMMGSGALRISAYRQARLHLDLTDIPSLVREERSIELSRELFEVLQAAHLELDTIPLDSVENSVSIYRQPSGDEIIVSRSVIGEWRFSRETVQAIPRMYSVLTEKGKIESLQVPKWLDFEFLRLSGLQWLLLVTVPLISWAMALALVYGLRRFLSARLGVKAESLNFLQPARYTLICLTCWAVWSTIGLPQSLLVVLAAILKLMATVATVLSLFGVCDAITEKMSQWAAQTTSTYDDMLVPLLRRSCKLLIVLLGVIFIAQNLDIEVWSLFAGFSIVGAMVALAGQETVKNFFGSFTILLDRPFSVGDWITVEGVEGIVEEVGFRATRIRTFYDSIVTVPNSRFITATVDNYGARVYRRYTTKLNLHYATPLSSVEAFCEGIREVILRHPHTRKEGFQVWVNDYSAYSLQILIYVFWRCPNWDSELQERHRFLMDVHGLARALELQFAYPTQSVLLQPVTESPLTATGTERRDTHEPSKAGP